MLLKLRTLMMVFLFSGALSPTLPAFAATAESDKPVRIIVNDWSSQIVLSHLLGNIYTSMGYNVEYVKQTTELQWGDLHRGTAHVQVEVWEGTMKEPFERISTFGNIVDAGNHTAVTREEWWYPAYVEALCPGLPDWKSLKKCSAIFATTATAPKGRYLAGPWEKPEKARIRALGLDFVVELAKNSDELWSELEKAYQQRKPIILHNWSPNWVESRYDGKFIEFPTYAPECETVADWGVSKEWTHDCGNPSAGWLKKVAWVGMKNTWPCALTVLENMNLNNADIASIAALVDKDGLSHEQAATSWESDHTAIVASWIPNVCR